MIEYEYSFKVKDITPYIAFCENNGFVLQETVFQERTVYNNTDGTRARITKNFKNKKLTACFLDFKKDNSGNNLVKESTESQELEITNLDAVYSILDFLGYKKSVTLLRTRTTYQKDNVKFELDSYTSPFKDFVVAIEGEKQQVDFVYKELEKENYEKL